MSWKSFVSKYSPQLAFRNWFFLTCLYDGYLFFPCSVKGETVQVSYFSLVGLVTLWNFIYLVAYLVNSSLVHSGKVMILKVIWLFIVIKVEVVIFPAFYALNKSRSPYPLVVTPHLHLIPIPLATTNLLSISMVVVV